MALFTCAPASQAQAFIGAMSGVSAQFAGPGVFLGWSPYVHWDPVDRLAMGGTKGLGARFRIYPWQRLVDVTIPQDSFFFSMSSRNRLIRFTTHLIQSQQRQHRMIRSTSRKALTKGSKTSA